MGSARTPPPARMFHATTRIVRARASARFERHGTEQRRAARVRIVRVRFEADPLDRPRVLTEDSLVIGQDIAPLAHPLTDAGRPRTDDDQHTVENVELVGTPLRADGG